MQFSSEQFPSEREPILLFWYVFAAVVRTSSCRAISSKIKNVKECERYYLSECNKSPKEGADATEVIELEKGEVVPTLQPFSDSDLEDFSMFIIEEEEGPVPELPKMMDVVGEAALSKAPVPIALTSEEPPLLLLLLPEETTMASGSADV